MEYGLIGEKLVHSFSKDIHSKISEKIGNYDYQLKEIPKDELNSFLTQKNFKGLNVTIPYKQEVIPYLDFIDDVAKEIGAVNTIVNKNGKLYGYNTDFIGLKKLILKTKIDVSNKKVLILGTGGTSKTAFAVVKALGAKQIIKVSRNVSENTITYEQAVKDYSDANIIINTTPCGMFPNTNQMPIELNNFNSLDGVIDVIYNPLKTNLIIQAEKNGLKAQGGLFMLVQQAISAAELFFEKEINVQLTENIYQKLLFTKQNIVLIGMPGSGKTTIGKLLSEKLNKNFIDTDEEIIKFAGKTPAQIITENGEEYFRDIETEICTKVSSKNNSIIATGGGAILRDINTNSLKNNGILIFLDRDISKICPTEDRPLSNDKDKLLTVYNKRYPIYNAVSDFQIKTDENLENTIKMILKCLKFEEE